MKDVYPIPAVEKAIGDWASTRACVWEYGKVYGEQGNALGW